MAYGKIFESLFTGSMIGSGCNVFALWSYVIASAKPPGTVELNPRLLASIFGCSAADIAQAIDFLCRPDPESRNKEHEGRRLLREGQFLYAVPSWPKYNAIRNEIERRQQNREAARRYRERKGSSSSATSSDDAMTKHDDHSASAESANTVCISSTSTESSGTGRESTRERGEVTPRHARSRSVTDPLFDRFWEAYGKKVDKVAATKAWAKLCPSQELAETIITSAAAYSKSRESVYRKDPHRWLNGRCWEDEIITPGSTLAVRRPALATLVGDHSDHGKPTKNGWTID